MSARWWRWPALGLAGAGLLAAGFWAGQTALAPAPVPQDLPASQVLVEVTEQTVGRTLTLGVSVEQPKQALAANALTGVVTAVGKSGTVEVGDTLYSVAKLPVRAVQGGTPFYRELSTGARGADVQQLRDALVELGHLTIKGDAFDYRTRVAVRAWQKELGIPQTGAVALGELVAVPKLPVALLLDRAVITKGGVLVGGEKIVYGATGEPAFTLVLTEQQGRLVPGTATIAMDYQDKHWEAVITETVPDDSGNLKLKLAAPDGGPVCGADCDLVATGSELNILAQVAVVPPASGPAVPVAAVLTNPDGTASVTVVDAAGSRTERTVTVLGSQDGVAVVEGVRPGEQVQVLGSAPGGGAPPPAAPEPAPATETGK